MTLAEKLANASKEVGGKLSADKTNTQDRYDYVSADKILSVCGQALANAGIVILPEITHEAMEAGQSKSGTPRHDAIVEMVFHIMDGETSIDNKWIGRGSDYTVPDKALYKAITSGHKYFLAKLLNVGAGNEDGEHEDGEKPAQKPTQKPSKPAPQPPAPDGAKLWNRAAVSAILEHQLAENQPNARAMLDLSELDADVPAKVAVAWSRNYRAARDEGAEPPAAAEQANAKYREYLKSQ